MTRPSVAPLSDRFDGVRHIAVLRGGGLGDLVFALPAIEALAAAYPGADVTLLGMPAHKALLAGRPGTSVHDVEVLPAAPGVRDGEPNQAAIDDFFARMQARGFDLAMQAHGGGRNSNPFLLQLGATHTIGTATEDAARLERDLPYRYYQHEVQRWLEVAGLAGAAPVDLEPRLGVTEEERAEGRALLGEGPVLVIHPGATDPRRRWPAERFAAVAAEVVRAGASVLVVGDASDEPIAHEIVVAATADLPTALQPRVRSAVSALTLPQLAGVLAAADLVLANDSGPRHLAQALGTRTVGLFWFGNALNAAPMGRSMHRLLLAWVTACPVCGADVTQVGWKAERCPHDPSFLTDIQVPEVLAEVRDLLPA